MILSHARTFLETYRTGSVTGAARSLGITQPAASAHIRGLEHTIGKPLFLREGRGLTPTPIADDLARSLATPLDDVERILSSARARSEAIAGTVHIAGPGEFTQYMAARAMNGLLPLGIRLRVRTGGRSALVQYLREGQIDLAILAHEFRGRSIESEVIYSERLLPVATPEWAARNLSRPFRAEQLLEKPAIDYDESLPMIATYFKAVCGIDCTDQAAVTVPDLRIVLEFVRGGQGYAVLPDYVCAKALQSGELINLHAGKSPAPLNHLYLVWPKAKLRDARVLFVRDHLLAQFG